MHPAFRAGFEKSAENDPTADPLTHVLAPVGMALAARAGGKVVGHALESPEAGQFVGRAVNRLAQMQRKQLEDDSPEPVAPVKTHEGVF